MYIKTVHPCKFPEPPPRRQIHKGGGAGLRDYYWMSCFCNNVASLKLNQPVF